MPEKQKRKHDRVKGGKAKKINLKTYDKKIATDVDDFADALIERDRKRAREELKSIDRTNRDALAEFEKTDKAIIRKAFVPNTRSTAHIPEPILEEAMDFGVREYEKNVEEMPKQFTHVAETQLDPKEVIDQATFLIITSRKTVRRSGMKASDASADVNSDEFKRFADVFPVSRHPEYLEHLDELTPANEEDLREDIEAFYTYLTIQQSLAKEERPHPFPLAQSYISYKAKQSSFGSNVS